MTIPRLTKSKRLSTKIQAELKAQELIMADPAAYKMRCELEGQRYRTIKTARDVVDLLEWATNCLISKAQDARTVSTIGYMSAISLQAIKLAKAESSPEEQLSEKLKYEQLKLNMTEEEMKALLASTNVNVQINILNKAADRPQFPEIEMQETILSQDYLNPHLGEQKIPSVIRNVLMDASKEARGISDNPEVFTRILDEIPQEEALDPVVAMIPMTEENHEDTPN